ncbi:MAG TPA: hypothetical protein P5531_12030 [Bacteroidales bacterium]|nr:hypothetical protein [Bacteroidales bacterium]HSA44312.1 hypothetical protein [Bacteroidales bacterium]
MKKSFCIPLLLLFAVTLFTSEESSSQSISISGGWSPSVSSANISDAGLDFSSPFTSAGTVIAMNIDVNPNNSRYRINVARSDVSWNTSFELQVRRTSDGNGPPASQISGGTSFITITTGNTVFFSGRRDRTEVDIEYSLEGVSATLPAAIYSTTVVYTLVQL